MGPLFCGSTVRRGNMKKISVGMLMLVVFLLSKKISDGFFKISEEKSFYPGLKDFLDVKE
jgi:hypothetical protein